MSNIGGNALAKVFLSTAQKVSADNIRFPVIGTLDESLNLKLDGFGRDIPSSDYHKIKGLALVPWMRVLCLPIEDGHTLVLLGEVE